MSLVALPRFVQFWDEEPTIISHSLKSSDMVDPA